MDEAAFRQHLKRAGKQAHVIDGLVAQVGRFASFLEEDGRGLDDARPADLDNYAAAQAAGRGGGGSHVRALALYYAFAGRPELAAHAAALREAQTAAARRAFALRDFRGVDVATVEALAARGVVDVADMLAAGRTPEQRRALATAAGVAPERVLELVKLSDLARLGGLKGVRARLYYDAGADTPAAIAAWEPEALEHMLADFVARSGFEGLAPLPKEVRSTVRAARALPPAVEY